MKNIIFISPPAGGKGTQSTKLKEVYGYNHLSAGDMLRRCALSNTDLGNKVKDIMSKGELVSDDIITNLIKEELKKCKDKPFILDGYPRTLKQAEALDSIDNIDYVVIYFNISMEDSLKRALGRLTCSCGKSYNLYIDELKPKVEGICDNCKKLLEKRSDDNEESFKVRFNTFIENTKPLIEYYENKNKLYKIDVNKDVDSIFNDIVSIIDNRGN